MLHPSNAQELTRIARELGGLVLRGPLQYPGPATSEWEIGPEMLNLIRVCNRARIISDSDDCLKGRR